MLKFGRLILFSVLSLFLVSFAFAGVDLNVRNVDLNDPVVIYGEPVDINVFYANDGDANATEDYNILFYINDVLRKNHFVDINSLDANFNVGQTNYYSYVWDANIFGDVDINACVLYSGTDDNNLNNCRAVVLHVYSADINATDLNFSDPDANIDYGVDVNVNFYYTNSGDANISDDYNLLFYVGGVVLETKTISSDLNSNNNDNNYFTWDSNISGDVNIGVCADYVGDVNRDNDCLFATLHVRAVDLEAVDLDLNDAALVEGEGVRATFTYKNSGDLNATANYTVKFYRNSTLITGCSFTVTDDLAPGTVASKTCDFTAPSVSSTTSYTITAIIDYNGFDSKKDNNSATTTLTVKNSTSDTSNKGGSTEEKKVDFVASSLTFKDNVLVNTEVIFNFTFKNSGNLKSSDDFKVSITVLQGGKTVTSCSEEFDDEIAVGKTKKYSCKWTPAKAGKYDVVGKVIYSGSEKTTKNNKIKKVITVIEKVVTKKDTTKKTDQNIPQTSLFISDLNKALASVGLKLVDVNAVYSSVDIIRTFKCDKDVNDANKEKCTITLKIKNIGDKNLKDCVYYEILPDLNGNKRFYKFDINSLDINKEVVLDYTLAGPISLENQKKFFGFVTLKDLFPEISESASKVEEGKSKVESSSAKTSKTLALVVIGILVVALAVLLVFYYLRQRSLGYHKRFSFKERKSSSPRSGFKRDSLERQKYRFRE